MTNFVITEQRKSVLRVLVRAFRSQGWADLTEAQLADIESLTKTEDISEEQFMTTDSVDVCDSGVAIWANKKNLTPLLVDASTVLEDGTIDINLEYVQAYQVAGDRMSILLNKHKIEDEWYD